MLQGRPLHWCTMRNAQTAYAVIYLRSSLLRAVSMKQIYYYTHSRIAIIPTFPKLGNVYNHDIVLALFNQFYSKST